MIRSALILADDPHPEDPHALLLAQATVETLRACIHGSRATLVPAHPAVLSLAAVIARSLRTVQAPFADEPDRDEERAREAPRTGRFIPYRVPDFLSRMPERMPDVAAWFSAADLGGPVLEMGASAELRSMEAAMDALPPDIVFALSPQPVGAELLMTLKRPPRVCYFPSLLGERWGEFGDLFGRWEPVDLQRRWLDREEPDDDPETGRSGDEGLEPFVPFGVLAQAALWPEADIERAR